MNRDEARVNAQPRQSLDPFFQEIERVLVGQRRLFDRLIVALLTGGHVLLEGVPGLAKTLAVRTMAQALDLSFARIQFTPDLLPADVVGTQIYNSRTGEFTVKPGPIFANLVLADEINRAPAKVQSALLEAMQELQVTLSDGSHSLPQPFMVLATQNPIEHEGTYPLPEAQLDRFMFKVLVSYPSRAEEMTILDRMVPVSADLSVNPTLKPNDLIELRRAIDAVYVDEKIKRYVLDVIHTTRQPSEFGLDVGPLIEYGASPRASIYLIRAAKGSAFLDRRDYVTPHDVKSMAPDILRHRLVLTYEAEAEEIGADVVVRRILEAIPIP